MIRAICTAVLASGAVVSLLGHHSTSFLEPSGVQPNASALAHEYAEVNGVRLHYVRAGRGPLIMFLHGFPEFWYEWKNQLAEFGRDHTVVAPDLRGYNLSSKPEELSAYLMPNLVEDVRALATESAEIDRRLRRSRSSRTTGAAWSPGCSRPSIRRCWTSS